MVLNISQYCMSYYCYYNIIIHEYYEKEYYRPYEKTDTKCLTTRHQMTDK